MSKPMRLHAGAPLPTLVKALARARWGELGATGWQGVRSVVRALGDVLDPRSGAGHVTVHQIAAAAGLSERWTRSRLEVVEALGLLTWVRGGVVAGRPVPSTIRVDKAGLIALIAAARQVNDERMRERARQTRERIAHLVNTIGRRAYVRTGPAFKRNGHIAAGQAHAELASGLPPTRGGSPPAAPPGEVIPTMDDTTTECEHGFPTGRLPNGQHRCPMCRREHAPREAEADAEVIAARAAEAQARAAAARQRRLATVGK